MDRKVRIMRFWLLCLASLGIAWLYPDPTLALAPIAFFSGQAGCFCCPQACGVCTAGTALTPAQYQVEVSGMANDECVDCADLDATYIVDYTGSIPGDRCTWAADITGAACNATIASLTFDIFTQIISFSLADPIAGAAGSWRQSQSFASFDCDVTDYNLPVFGNAATHVCDHTGSTCLLTAL